MSEHYSFPLLERENIEVTVELLLSASSGRPKAPALRIHLKAVAKTTGRFGNFVICRPDKAFVTNLEPFLRGGPESSNTTRQQFCRVVLDDEILPPPQNMVKVRINVVGRAIYLADTTAGAGDG